MGGQGRYVGIVRLAEKVGTGFVIGKDERSGYVGMGRLARKVVLESWISIDRHTSRAGKGGSINTDRRSCCKISYSCVS